MSERQRIVVTVGLPGCGKSTYLARLGVNAISSDEVRRLLIDDPTDQTIHVRTFATIRYLLRQRLAVGRKVTHIDATHLTRNERRPYFKIANWYGCDVEALYFDLPIATCLERNRQRERNVPPEAIELMATRLQAPVLDEGFTKIVTVGS